MSCDIIEGLHADLSVSVQILKEKLGPPCPKSGYSIVMRLHDMRVNAKSSRLRQGGQWSSRGPFIF
jgi:hypothetical protein